MIDINSEKRLNDLLERYGNNSHSHLYYLGDKEWFWDSDYEALIVYRSVLNRRIVLGDPVGNPQFTSRVIKQFVADCDENKQIPVFYQAKSSFLPLYEQLGLSCSKIGEEAQVNLSTFHLNGKQWLKLRNRMSKFGRTGFTFEVLHPPYSDSFLDRLQAISDEWLGSRKEKSFSVGSFAKEYVIRFPVALLVGPDGNYEAFVSIAGDHQSFADRKREESVGRRITVDLMRYTKACPHGTMDALFISLFLWAKEQTYDVCSLGMAPLANVTDSHIVKLLYKYGNKLYNFKGLYEYKNKFAPKWENIYLVSQPAATSINVALLALIIHSTDPDKQSTGKIPSKHFIHKVLFSKKRA
ncbi:phosphatidylglycerol lysyltransferase domain-containing protein [Bacillus sp. FJAT-28004]|uniref:phosphatidylglycerol lysyltransferase domain-containing protein n=1 Tax=Bacillus sp. FJAT-28004 TaxID=1679165 RepID=UPI0006B4CC4F|nr:phosphatidylglycerol lysyltransferase domain-containing protein [Bacillus sp. FJAT-28004]